MSRKMIFPRGINASRPPGTIIHKIPKIPIMIDNIETERDAVREFYGQPLHTVIDFDASTGKMLQIFSTKEKAEEYYRQVSASSGNHWTPKRTPMKKTAMSVHDVPPGQGVVDLYEHIDFEGCTWRLLEGDEDIPDFRKLLACGTLWWGWKNANDQISSLELSINQSYTFILCEHINYEGSWLWISGGHGWIRSLVDYGWNDRASSLIWNVGSVSR